MSPHESFWKPEKGADYCEKKRSRDRAGKAFRDAVWFKYGWKDEDGKEVGHCVRCKRYIKRGDTGTVDHKLTRSTHPELKYDPNNGRLACWDCNDYFKKHPTERAA